LEIRIKNWARLKTALIAIRLEFGAFHANKLQPDKKLQFPEDIASELRCLPGVVVPTRCVRNHWPKGQSFFLKKKHLSWAFPYLPDPPQTSMYGKEPKKD
jgi:hypothetical protein